MKKVLALVLVLILTLCCGVSAMAGTVTSDLSKSEGSIAFINGMLITTANDELFLKGVIEQLETWGDWNVVDMSPAEQKVDQQIAKIQEAIALGFDTILLSAVSSTGYDAVYRQAAEAGVKIISFNSKASPDYRTVHIAQVDPYQFSEYNLASLVLFTLQPDDFDPATDDLIESAKAAAAAHGEPITVGIMSTLPDSPVQAVWVAGIEEAAKDYPIDISFEIKFTQNVQANGATLVDAYNALDNIKGFTTLSTSTISTCVNALAATESDLCMTGCMWPSTIVDFMPAADAENIYEASVPWGLGWDFEAWGNALGAACAQTINGTYDGSVGSELIVNATSNYPARTLVTAECDDGGTQLFSQDVVIFTSENIDSYVAQEQAGNDYDYLNLK